jgi:hypothetical protein
MGAMGSTRMKLHLAHQLAGDEHRPTFAGQAPQQVPDPADAVGVQPVHRLVRIRTPGSPGRAAAIPSRWPSPSREALDPPVGDLCQPGQLPLHAGPLQQPADLAVHPTQVVQQPIAELTHLIGLMHHRRPVGLHLGADLLGHLPRLLQYLLRLGGDIGPHLLGLLLGLLDDRVGAAPGVLDHLLGRAARVL